MTKKESEIKYINYAAERVYARLSDLRNFQAIQAAVETPGFEQMILSQQPDLDVSKIQQLKDALRQLQFTEDTITAQSPVGAITLRVVEREEGRLVKLATENAPLEAYLWVQILPTDVDACKMRVTTGAEVNMFMKAIVSKPLQQAADGLAQLLSSIPY